MRTFIYTDELFLASGVKNAGCFEVTDGLLGEYTKELPEGEVNIIDQSGKWIAPGLVDTHIHGYMNHNVMDNDVEGIKVMSEGLLSCGATSFLPTTLTLGKERLRDVAGTIGRTYQEAPGAKIKGVYFEGPFFTEERKGAQDPNRFGDPDLDTFHEWQEASGGLIKKIALAPGCQGVEESVKQVTEEGVVVPLGHSNATLEEAQKAVEAGTSVFVHALNGIRGLNHREPGMVGALLSLEHVFSELICDGHHVHPNMAGILMEKTGHEHVALITDCMMAGGMPDGNYNLGELPVVVKEGTARLESGNLAGNILKLKEAVKNIVDWGLATPEQVVMMASPILAISCKTDDTCGKIARGCDADFIALNPDMTLKATYLDGVERFHA